MNFTVNNENVNWMWQQALIEIMYFLFEPAFQSTLNGGQQSGKYIMVLQLLAEEQPLDGVVIGEEGHHVLQEEALAVGQQLGGVVDLGVDVV